VAVAVADTVEGIMEEGEAATAVGVVTTPTNAGDLLHPTAARLTMAVVVVAPVHGAVPLVIDFVLANS